MLPVSGRSVAAARTILLHVLRESDLRADPAVRQETAATAELLVSELVTNAVRHTRDLLQLEVRARDGRLLVAVTDDAPDPPVLRSRDDEGQSGRGMQIVDALADRWGVTLGDDRKSVWFELLLPSRPDGACR